MKFISLLILLLSGLMANAQESYPSDPEKARFITSDINLFWKAYDRRGGKSNPFTAYLEKGSAGVQAFISNRIESAKYLNKTVKRNEQAYEAIREKSLAVADHTENLRKHYVSFKELYPAAVFPPAYFVIGAFNSGGTSTDSGIIMGVEVKNDPKELPLIVIHELVHYNQQYAEPVNTLLRQSLMEGSADFICELVTGGHINTDAMQYFRENEESLMKEFVGVMNDQRYHGWLYGTAGKTKNRPNDLGYSIGYHIARAYYEKQNDKQKAIYDILTIENFDKFITDSGYLTPYLEL
ncbi:MAG: DUF2268 domain-containing putative Zn-dependent protease [Cyclobacteriaceae bacterium]